MTADQSLAIILRTTEFSETSLIVTLFTRDFGKLAAIAKGARRPKGPFEGSLDLLSVCRVVVHRKNSDVLDLLTEAKLNRRFRGADRSLERLYAGYYVAELLRLMTDDHDPHVDVYDLTISILNQIDGVGSVAVSILAFEAQMLRRLGHAPTTDRCSECGKESLVHASRVSFALSAGGVVCAHCAPRQHGIISVSRKAINTLETLISFPLDPPVASSDLPSVDREVYGELRGVMSRYIQTVVGKIPRTQHLLPHAMFPHDSSTEPTA